MDKELLQSIGTLMDTKLTPMHEQLSKIDERIIRIEDRVTHIEEDIEILKEDAVITRNGVNILLEWAEQVQIEVKTPLYKKAE